jgi:hypothetical protein
VQEKGGLMPKPFKIAHSVDCFGFLAGQKFWVIGRCVEE